MKIRNKIIVFSFLWLVLIQLFVNLLIYFMFIRTVTENEKETLRSKAEQMVFELGTGLFEPGMESRLRPYLPDHSMIRVLDEHVQTVNLLYNHSEAVSVKPELVSEFSSVLDRSGAHRILVVRQPIVIQDQVKGTLEIAEVFISLENNLSILISILLTSMVVVFALALLGGITLSRIILEPITRLIRTMKENEESLSFKKIPLADEPKDELYMMTMTFNRMMERIEESFARQKQFVSDASHELKTTLTIIESYANMLRRWGMENRELQKEAVETIHSESIRMKKMTLQLLDLASSEQKLDFHFEPFDLVALSRNIARLFYKIFKREVRVIPEESEITAVADKMKIQQVLLILLDNALKYSKETVEIYLWRHGNQVCAKVKDYGIGIPKQDLHHIFERFYRVDKARTRATGGTGLGLAIAKAIISGHEGTIGVASREGEGTEITFCLPKDGPSTPNAEAEN